MNPGGTRGGVLKGRVQKVSQNYLNPASSLSHSTAYSLTESQARRRRPVPESRVSTRRGPPGPPGRHWASGEAAAGRGR
eukprot:748964-Hanusia_phi.AAC.1